MASGSIIRRTSFIVADVEKTAAFYQHIFGWTRFYDNETPVDKHFPPCAPDGTPAHIIILQADDPNIGMVGFMSYIGVVPEETITSDRKTLGIGDSILIVESCEIEAVHQRAGEAGAHIVTAPVEWTVAQPTGKGRIKLCTFSFFDLNGIYVEVNTRLGEVD